MFTYREWARACLPWLSERCAPITLHIIMMSRRGPHILLLLRAYRIRLKDESWGWFFPIKYTWFGWFSASARILLPLRVFYTYVNKTYIYETTLNLTPPLRTKILVALALLSLPNQVPLPHTSTYIYMLLFKKRSHGRALLFTSRPTIWKYSAPYRCVIYIYKTIQ